MTWGVRVQVSLVHFDFSQVFKKEKEESNLMIFLVEESEGITKLICVILGALTVLLVMVIIGLVVKVRKLQTGTFSMFLSVLYLVLLQVLKVVSICWKNTKLINELTRYFVSVT